MLYSGALALQSLYYAVKIRMSAMCFKGQMAAVVTGIHQLQLE